MTAISSTAARNESSFAFAWFAKPADFSHELQRGCSNLFSSGWRIKVEKGFNVPAHSVYLKVSELPCRVTDASLFCRLYLNSATLFLIISQPEQEALLPNLATPIFPRTARSRMAKNIC